MRLRATMILMTMILWTAAGCSDVPEDEPDGPSPTSVDVDVDGDGFDADIDCDDEDASTYPGADELCNALDGNGDGYRECSSDGEPGDCDDDDASVNPGADEVGDTPAVPVDNDYDGLFSSEEIDDDGDGMTECQGDCDDSDPDVLEGALEVCDGKDNDCDEQTPADEVDEDGDGWRAGATKSLQTATTKTPTTIPRTRRHATVSSRQTGPARRAQRRWRGRRAECVFGRRQWRWVRRRWRGRQRERRRRWLRRTITRRRGYPARG